MSSLQAIHDRFGRNIAFGLVAALDDQADVLARVIATISAGDGRVG